MRGEGMKLWRFVQKEKGAISIFMAVIMMSMFVLTSVFVDGSRLRSAETIIQSASDSAARSVMAKYDIELKDRYGLFTLEESEQEKIKEDYLKFFAANVSAEVPGADDSFHEYLNQIMAMISGETEQTPLDLFDVQIADAKVGSAYSIIEPDVLQKQMVEFAKYRGAFAVADLFDIMIGDKIKENMEKAKIDTQNVKKTLDSREAVEDVMQDCYEWSDDLQEKKKKFDQNRDSWREDIQITQSCIGGLKDVMEDIVEVYEEIEDADEDDDISGLEEELEELQEDAEDIYYDSPNGLKYYKIHQIADLIETLQDLKVDLEKERQKVQPFLNRIAQAKGTVTQSKNSLQSGGTDDVKENLEKDADTSINELDKLHNIVKENEKWLQDTISRLENILQKLETLSGDITAELSEADYKGEAEENAETLNDLEDDALKTANLFQNATGEVKQYHFEHDFGVLAEQMNSLYKLLQGDIKVKTTNTLGEPAVIDDAKKALLPSVKYRQDDTYHTDAKYAEMDAKYIQLQQSTGIDESAVTNIPLEDIDAENAKQSLNIIGNFMDLLSDMATGATNKAVTDLYTMSMFKARTTQTVDYWKTVYGDSLTSIDGKPYDRERAEKEDRNLRLIEKASFNKADGTSFMDAELEYVIIGNMNEKNNADSVYARIFGIRMGFNTIAVLADKDLNDLSTAAASIAGPFAPLAKVGIILVLALVETYLDMYFLLDKGYKVPLLKFGYLTFSLKNLEQTMDDLLLIDFEDMEGLELFSLFKPSEGDENAPPTMYIDYETYISFLLLLVDRETKLLRMADIMQLNMQIEKGDAEYCMADHYTAIRAETEATIKPMMMGLPFVPDDMRKDGRYSIKTMIYEGY